jgi:hypothetical protein
MSTAVYSALSKYLIGPEKVSKHRYSFPLHQVARTGDIESYIKLINKGYNPFRKNDDDKMSFELVSVDKNKFIEASSEWISQLACDCNPDLDEEEEEKSDDE